MRAYWVTYVDGTKACHEGVNEDEARTDAQRKARKEVATIRPLPYPANPRPNPLSSTPSFCYTPDECAGNSSCRKRRACTE